MAGNHQRVQMKHESERRALGERIRARRKALRITQRKLAREIGTCAANLCHIEKGERYASYELVRKIARALRCTLKDIHGRKT